MDFNGFGGLFADDPNGQEAHNLQDVLEVMTNGLESGRIDVADALECLLNIVKPGATEMSHDILSAFKSSMYVLGFKEVANQVKALWLTLFPWGIGFHMGFEKDYPVRAMSTDARKAMVTALVAVLNAGGIDAVVSPSGHITVSTEDGETQSMNIDSIVAEFREELDTELGPSPAPQPADETTTEITDWMRRWMQ